jgi:hypothetical protein
LVQQFSLSPTAVEHNMPGQERLHCPQLLLHNGSSPLQSDAHTALWWWLLHDHHASGSSVTCTPDFFNGVGCTCEMEGQQLVPPPSSNAAAAAGDSHSRDAVWTCDYPNGMSPAAAEAANLRMNVNIAAAVIAPWAFVFLVWRLYR